MPDVPDYLASPDATISDKDAKWRYGHAPDYAGTRAAYAAGKTSNHTAGSLPSLVENLVKNWEVEASHKLDLSEWRTIDHSAYSFRVNGGPPSGGEDMLRVGTYNALLAPNELYDPAKMSFADSHKAFKGMMPTFAWEVLEVFSGPPRVAFRWRHWGTMDGDYVGVNPKGEKVTVKAHGGLIEVFGVTIATVNEKVQLQSVDTYFDPAQMFRQIAPEGVQQAEEVPGDAWTDMEQALSRAMFAFDQMAAGKGVDQTGENGGWTRYVDTIEIGESEDVPSKTDAATGETTTSSNEGQADPAAAPGGGCPLGFGAA